MNKIEKLNNLLREDLVGIETYIISDLLFRLIYKKAIKMWDASLMFFEIE